MRKSRTLAAVVLTVTLALPAVAAPRQINDGNGPIDRIVRIIKKIFAPVTTMEQPIIPVPNTTT